MTSDVDELARLLWTQLWQVTVVALVIGTVVRVWLRDWPRLAYALWLLVVVKALVPPVWSSPTGLFSWVLAGSSAARLEAAGQLPRPLLDLRATADTAPALATESLAEAPARNRAPDWGRVRLALFLIWGTGLVLGVAFMIGKQIACAHLIGRSRLPVKDCYVSALADLSGRLGVKRPVRLLVTSRPIGPAVYGLLRPSILLPAPLLAGMAPERLELILAHELIHVRRGDVFVGKLQLVAQLLWWFHPLVWWANRELCRERERCCDQEVVTGIGCRPALYARTLLNVLEQKGRLRSLVTLPGVRALEVTSHRLESIMRYVETDLRRASWSARLVFAAGLILLVPGTGLTLQGRSLASDGADVTVTPGPTESASRILGGIVREKGTGHPLAGARINVSVVGDGPGRAPSSAVSDDAGHYTITDLSRSREYTLIAMAKAGEPYLITSRKVDAADDDGALTADVEFVRGIPFRVRILDRETGKPLKGSLSYFPISPNNPFERGVMGYAATASKGGAVCGAFYEADPDDQGQFHGAVLPGPGVLGFNHPYRPGDESRADRKPLVSFPDGKQNIKLMPEDPAAVGIGRMALVPIRSDPIAWTGLTLGQYDAVIAIDPRDGAEVVTYEIWIAPDKAGK
jgi:beta-lactamase regulating signal transducer with metallopeptidase domain